MSVYKESDREGLKWTIFNSTKRGYCAVCVRSDCKVNLGECLERSLPSSRKALLGIACPLCKTSLRAVEYPGHVGRCLVTYHAVLSDVDAGRISPSNYTSPWPPVKIKREYSGSSATRRTAPSTAPMARAPTASRHRAQGTQTEKPQRTTCNASTQTKKIDIAPGQQVPYIRWQEPTPTEDLLGNIWDGEISHPLPLISPPDLHEDLLNLQLGETEEMQEQPGKEDETAIDQETGSLAELDPYHPSAPPQEDDTDSSDETEETVIEKSDSRSGGTNDTDTAASETSSSNEEEETPDTAVAEEEQDTAVGERDEETHGVSPYLRYIRRGPGRGRRSARSAH